MVRCVSSNVSNEINLNGGIAWYETKITCSLMNHNHACKLVECASASNENTSNESIDIKVKSMNTYNISEWNEKPAIMMEISLIDMNRFGYEHE